MAAGPHSCTPIARDGFDEGYENVGATAKGRGLSYIIIYDKSSYWKLNFFLCIGFHNWFINWEIDPTSLLSLYLISLGL